MNLLPELLLPVGNISMCLAAIHAGADAIYVGAPEFNARGRSKEHNFDELKEMVDICHLYNVRVHVAFNVLIFESEFKHALEIFIKLIELGVDAFIVQDLGLAQKMRQICPEVELHASTQMTVTSYEHIELLKDLKFSRYILGREVSLNEMKKIRQHTDAQLEVFVHGALCVAYSGQCFTSEGIGGRSANRGQCAQSCRLDYELFVDGNKKDLGDKKYLLSPLDLMGIDEIPNLVELGIHSLKVEGRLKSPQYVAQCGRSYRSALDHLRHWQEKEKQKAKTNLAKTYSRGFYSGWLHGVNHQKLVDGSSCEHRGLFLGPIEKIENSWVWIKTQLNLNKGDGLLFVDDKGREWGGKIWNIKISNSKLALNFSNEFPLSNLKIGMKCFQTSDPHLHKNLEQIYTQKDKQKKIPLTFELKLEMGQVARLIAKTEQESMEIVGEEIIEQAQKRPLTNHSISGELSALGGSIYQLRELNIFGNDNGNLFLSQQELKKMRQKMIFLLNEKRVERKIKKIIQVEFDKKYEPKKKEVDINKHEKLNVLVRDETQLNVIEEILLSSSNEKVLGLGSIVLDFEFGKDYSRSVQRIKSWGLAAAVATTRIHKSGELSSLAQIERSAPNEILVRNFAALNYFKKRKTEAILRADFSFNIANSFAANFIHQFSLYSQCPSYDLNETQLIDLITSSPEINFEITMHQYLPLFHMEHCVFAAFLSQGSSYKDCGMPCEKHQVELRDHYGGKHFLHADMECRNTVFQGQAQSAFKLIPKLKELGIKEFRLETLKESPSLLKEKILTCLNILQGNYLEDSWHRLQTLENYGVASGQLLNHHTYRDRKKTSEFDEKHY